MYRDAEQRFGKVKRRQRGGKENVDEVGRREQRREEAMKERAWFGRYFDKLDYRPGSSGP